MMNLNELRRIHAESTQGDWMWGAGSSACLCESGLISIDDKRRRDVFVNCGRGGGQPTEEDIAFIVAAHNSMPELLDRLERYEAALREIEAYGLGRDPITARIALEGK